MRQPWRMLGVFPDAFDGPAAGALWQPVGAPLAAPSDDQAASVARPEDVLGDLLKYSMLEWNETAKRYRLHDLMRDFPRARLEEASEDDQVARRHAMHYLGVLARADDLYIKGGDSIEPGLALFDLEWGNIQAGQAWAAAHAERDNEAARLCTRYPNAGTYCLELRQHPRERIRWREVAISRCFRQRYRCFSFFKSHLTRWRSAT